MKDRLDALAEFLPIFETPDFEFGHFVDEPGTFGYYSFSEDASRFIDVCYEMKWVNLSFYWSAWKDSAEALQLRDDPAALESATPRSAAKPANCSDTAGPLRRGRTGNCL